MRYAPELVKEYPDSALALREEVEQRLECSVSEVDVLAKLRN